MHKIQDIKRVQYDSGQFRLKTNSENQFPTNNRKGKRT